MTVDGFFRKYQHNRERIDYLQKSLADLRTLRSCTEEDLITAAECGRRIDILEQEQRLLNEAFRALDEQEKQLVALRIRGVPFDKISEELQVSYITVMRINRQLERKLNKIASTLPTNCLGDNLLPQ